mmetsp:Transcript_2196/g.4452  ORF Transcript_2196/g.4452 Transcript_2196/m.4452 type:complete len:99 (+) Transcript_2196:287-583(+)
MRARKALLQNHQCKSHALVLSLTHDTVDRTIPLERSTAIMCQPVVDWFGYRKNANLHYDATKPKARDGVEKELTSRDEGGGGGGRGKEDEGGVDELHF